MKTIIGFLIGLACGFYVFINVFLPKPASDQVLAQATEASASPVPTEEPSTPSPEPTVEPTPDPTEEPTPKPKTPSPTPSASPTVTPVPAPTQTPDVWSPPALEPWFAQYAGMYGVDKNVLERIANCESHFNPEAKNGDYLGMFQFSTSTWTSSRVGMGADPNPALRANAEESIKTGAYLVSKRGIAPWPQCL